MVSTPVKKQSQKQHKSPTSASSHASTTSRSTTNNSDVKLMSNDRSKIKCDVKNANATCRFFDIFHKFTSKKLDFNIRMHMHMHVNISIILYYAAN
jgi:hypothetical protein